jgi:hypothetical protein
VKPISAEPYIQVYLLLRQQGLYFSTAGYSNNTLPGSLGFYPSRNEAEIARTHELLSNKDKDYLYHIFELDIPNPAYDIQSHQMLKT